MNKIYNWTRNSLTVICQACDDSTCKKCEVCKGKGFIEVGLQVEIKNKISPCCKKPWHPLALTALKYYECSKCKKQYLSEEVVGKVITE
jgi:hypothetical protein